MAAAADLRGVAGYIPLQFATDEPSVQPGDRVELVHERWLQQGTAACFHVFHPALCRRIFNLKDAEVLGNLLDEGLVSLDGEGAGEVDYCCLEEDGRSSWVNVWIKILIRRDSVEQVSTRLADEQGRGKVELYLRTWPGRFTYDRYCTEAAVFTMALEEFSSRIIYMDCLTPSADVIKLELCQHQKQGLKWLVDREEPEADALLPPFWVEKDGVYSNEVSRFITLKRPEPIRGGIFADESGMGKTLTLLSLIAHTKNNTSPGFVPSPSPAEELELVVGLDSVERSTSCSTNRRRRSTTAGRVSKKKKIDHHRSEEEDLASSSNLNSRPTLVVCPTSSLSTWEAEIAKCTWPGSLKTFTYNGKKTKIKDESILRGHDLVLTTYSTVAAEESSGSSILKHIEWFRVILDDVHQVLKTRGSKMSRAFMSLKGNRRWAVTGMPLCDGAYDFYPVFAFQQVHPFCFEANWKALIGRFLSSKTPSIGLQRLKSLMAAFSLRRTKGETAASLPTKSVEIHLVELSEEERDLYVSMEAKAPDLFNPFKSTSCLRVASTIIRQLRLVCNSAALCGQDLIDVFSSSATDSSSSEGHDLINGTELLKKLATLLQDEAEYACPVCLDSPAVAVITSCGHVFCRLCINKVMEHNEPSCPLCRSPISKSELHEAEGPSTVNTIEAFMDRAQSVAVSSKATALLKLLLETKNQSPDKKSVVFSESEKMLVLLEGILKEAGFKVGRLDSSVDAKQRARAVQELGNPEPMVLLSTLQAAVTTSRLDLSDASDVYLLEPCCDPEVEEQAVSRIHRLGQKNHVKIVRLMCRNTIEERIRILILLKRTGKPEESSNQKIELGNFDDVKVLLALSGRRAPRRFV